MFFGRHNQLYRKEKRDCGRIIDRDGDIIERHIIADFCRQFRYGIFRSDYARAFAHRNY